LARERDRAVEGGFWADFRNHLAWALMAITVIASGCSTQTIETGGPRTTAVSSAAGGTLTRASWYGPGFNGRLTSDGEVFNENALTAASRTLPIGSRVRVTNLNDGRSVIVRINDRGPYVHGRGIDLSERAAQEIGLDHTGVARVRVATLREAASLASMSPDTWSGPVRVRQSSYRIRHHRTRRYRRHSTRMVSNPVGTWLLALIR